MQKFDFIKKAVGLKLKNWVSEFGIEEWFGSTILSIEKFFRTVPNKKQLVG